MTVPSASAPLFRRVLLALKELAPYAAVELILPGGSLVALILWLHARRRARRAHELTTASHPRASITPLSVRRYAAE
jgi:hypothetical protein